MSHFEPTIEGDDEDAANALIDNREAFLCPACDTRQPLDHNCSIEKLEAMPCHHTTPGFITINMPINKGGNFFLFVDGKEIIIHVRRARPISREEMPPLSCPQCDIIYVTEKDNVKLPPLTRESYDEPPPIVSSSKDSSEE